MLFGLDYIVAGYAQLVATKPVVCKPLRAPEIVITASSTDLKTDHTRSIQELSTPIPGVKQGKSPYDGMENVFTEGLMLGSVQMPSEYQFTVQDFKNGQACIHINKINVRIEIDPKIYIAREYKKGTCHYNAVMEHERKHVAVERAVVNKYIQVVGQALKRNIDAKGSAFGPFPPQHASVAQKDLMKFFKAIIEPYAKKMEKEREYLQSQVDTLAEYQRVDAQCPDKPRYIPPTAKKP